MTRTLPAIADQADRWFRQAGDPDLEESERGAYLDLIRGDFFYLLGIAEAALEFRADVATAFQDAARLVHELPS